MLLLLVINSVCKMLASTQDVSSLGSLYFLCFDGHHAASFAAVSALEQLHACGVIQLGHVTDAFLIDARLLLGFFADPLYNLRTHIFIRHALYQYDASDKAISCQCRNLSGGGP